MLLFCLAAQLTLCPSLVPGWRVRSDCTRSPASRGSSTSRPCGGRCVCLGGTPPLGKSRSDRLPCFDHAHSSRSSQLSIYDAPTSTTSLVAIRSPVQAEVGHARRWLQESYDGLRARAREGAQVWIGWEGKAEGACCQPGWCARVTTAARG